MVREQLGISFELARDAGTTNLTVRLVGGVAAVTAVEGNVTGVPFPAGGVIVTETDVTVEASPVTVSATGCPA